MPRVGKGAERRGVPALAAFYILVLVDDVTRRLASIAGRTRVRPDALIHKQKGGAVRIPRTSKRLAAPRQGPLVFHFRGRRQWYGSGGLTQRELAELADVPISFVQEYERLRRFPVATGHLLRLALALHVPFEKIVAPQLLDRLIDEIEARRRAWVSRKNGG